MVAVAGGGGAGPAGNITPAFPFYKDKPTPNLEQGDLIPRNAPAIDVVLRKYHQYQVEKPGNDFFAVLTQSCDLVAHDGAQCKARYLVLAPVRPLRLIVNKEFRAFILPTPGGLVRLGSTETSARFDAFLEKVINNNDPRFFFLHADPGRGIAEDMCIMLALSVSIRAEHYATCLAGRTAQLDDLFQAKLGWLLGQQYSRVGTPDWDEETLAAKIAALSDQSMTWLPPDQFEQMKRQVEAFAAATPDGVLSEEDLLQMRKKCRPKVDLAIDAVFKVLEHHNLIEPPGPKAQKRFSVRKDLARDADFNKFFRDV